MKARVSFAETFTEVKNYLDFEFPDGHFLSLRLTDDTADAHKVAKIVNDYHELIKAAKEVMDTLVLHGPSIVPHLLDTDDNAGERLRQLIATAEAKPGV